MSDKYSAVWVSYSSISDFLNCPRAYYLRNVYKDPKSNHKISTIAPPLALGQAVHNVLEGLSILPTHKRFETPLVDLFEKEWQKVSGKNGGFKNQETENKYKERGIEMMNMVQKTKAPLDNLAVKIEMDLPNYWLSEEDNIILCGKVDWLEYLPDTDSVNIIDFKSSKSGRSEDPDSLQLPIYHLLVHNTQNRKVGKASYWYLESDKSPASRDLPDLDESYDKVLAVAKKMKVARQLESFECPEGKDGCMHCKPFESIINGEAEFIKVDDINRDIYIVSKEKEEAPEGKLL